MVKYISKLSSKLKNREVIKYIVWKLKIDFFTNSIIAIWCQFLNLITLIFVPFPKSFITIKYLSLKFSPSDINKHLKTIYELTLECDSVFETGVRGVVSSWAFLNGLKNNQNADYLLNDIENCDVDLLLKTAKKINVDCNFVISNNLNLEFNKNYDLTFIDTWHVYAQLARELEKFESITSKYIVLHDTTVDGDYGEAIRFNNDTESLAKITGYPKEEIEKGLWPAVEEFLENNSNWKLYKKFTHNNGLTILKKDEYY